MPSTHTTRSASSAYLRLLARVASRPEHAHVGKSRYIALARDMVTTAELYCTCKNRRCVICSAKREWWQDTIVPDLGAVLFANLAMTAWPLTRKRHRLFYPQLKEFRPQPDFVLAVLASNLANCIVSTRRLCCLGFDAQARHLVRLFAELADTLVAVASDVEYFKHYVNAPHDDVEHHWHWRKYLNPKITRRRVASELKKAGADLDVQTEMTDIFEDNYRWLSAFSHARWVGQVVGAMAEEKQTGRLRTSLFGRMSNASRSTLHTLGTQTWFTVSLFRKMLWDSHGWTDLKFRSNKGRWLLRGDLVTGAYIELLRATDEHPET